MTIKIGLLPYATKPGLGLAKVQLSDLEWPLEPDTAHTGTVADLGIDDHLIVPPNSHTIYLPHFGVRCKVSTYVVEPRSVHRRHFFWLRFLHWRFHRIFTYNAEFRARVPNSRFTLSGWAWVKNPEALTPVKTRMASLIASKKRDLAGHMLRHQVAEWCLQNGADVDLLGRGYLPFDKKEEGLAPYRFSIVIENSVEQGYVSEKMIDCLLCEAVPLYWGATDIGAYFDLDGIIVCNSHDDIIHEIGRLSEERYLSMLSSVKANRAKALTHAHFDRNLAEALRDESQD